MATVVQDDMFTPDVIADPYAYYGRLRDEDPVHWNERNKVWMPALSILSNQAANSSVRRTCIDHQSPRYNLSVTYRLHKCKS